MKYVIMIYCNRPESARLLKHENGMTKVYYSLDEASSIVEKRNIREGSIVARVVAT